MFNPFIPTRYSKNRSTNDAFFVYGSDIDPSESITRGKLVFETNGKPTMDQVLKLVNTSCQTEHMYRVEVHLSEEM